MQFGRDLDLSLPAVLVTLDHQLPQAMKDPPYAHITYKYKLKASVNFRLNPRRFFSLSRIPTFQVATTLCHVETRHQQPYQLNGMLLDVSGQSQRGFAGKITPVSSVSLLISCSKPGGSSMCDTRSGDLQTSAFEED